MQSTRESKVNFTSVVQGWIYMHSSALFFFGDNESKFGEEMYASSSLFLDPNFSTYDEVDGLKLWWPMDVAIQGLWH